MRRNNIIAVCAIFCVVAVAAGVLVSRLSRTQGVTAIPPTALGAISVTAPPAAIVAVTATQPTSTGSTESPTTAPTSTPIPAATTALATDASKPTATAAPAPVTNAPAYVEYTIQKGDILYTIAKKYNVTIEDILAINQIARPESLLVGQVIRIPKK
jgi:LysM repeat protein